MAHKDWCGKPCGECPSPCPLDESMPCSPDCEELNEDGTRDAMKCLAGGCDAFAATGGGCPVCGNGELAYGDSFLQDGSYARRWSCGQCGAGGKAVYSLTFVAHSMN